jgi:hypothetical protein
MNCKSLTTGLIVLAAVSFASADTHNYGIALTGVSPAGGAYSGSFLPVSFAKSGVEIAQIASGHIGAPYNLDGTKVGTQQRFAMSNNEVEAFELTLNSGDSHELLATAFSNTFYFPPSASLLSGFLAAYDSDGRAGEYSFDKASVRDIQFPALSAGSTSYASLTCKIQPGTITPVLGVTASSLAAQFTGVPNTPDWSVGHYTVTIGGVAQNVTAVNGFDLVTEAEIDSPSTLVKDPSNVVLTYPVSIASNPFYNKVGPVGPLAITYYNKAGSVIGTVTLTSVDGSGAIARGVTQDRIDYFDGATPVSSSLVWFAGGLATWTPG